MASRFYIEPIATKKLPEEVALGAFVKISGDTVGVVYFHEDGGIALWREGSCLGTFDNLLAVYAKLDKLNA